MLLQNSTLPACGAYVFGFSTGHVGTTTLCDKKTYADNTTNLDDVGLLFEPDKFVHFAGDETVVRAHGQLTIEEQEAHVRGIYLKEVSMLLGTRRVSWCVDLSHMTLHYFDGLIRVMRAEGLPFRLVRIRRDALEVARSLHGKFDVGYRPFDAPETLVLRVDRTVYTKFSEKEIGLFDADEAEAQWQRIDERSRRDALSCAWSDWPSLGGGLEEECVQPIAQMLGLQVTNFTYL